MTLATTLLLSGLVLSCVGAALTLRAIIDRDHVLAQQDALIAKQAGMVEHAQAEAERRRLENIAMGGFVKVLVARNQTLQEATP